MNSYSRMDYIAQIIRYHRKQFKLTQFELANKAGVGKTVIFDAEKGKRTIRFETLEKIFDALKIKLSFNSDLMNNFEVVNKNR